MRERRIVVVTVLFVLSLSRKQEKAVKTKEARIFGVKARQGDKFDGIAIPTSCKN